MTAPLALTAAYTPADLAQVLEDMWDVLGPPEAMESPHARAVFYLDLSRLNAAGRAPATTGTETNR